MVQEHEVLQQHRVAFEPPDLVTGAPKGTLTVEAAHIIWEFVDRSCAHVDRFYWMSDISGLDRYATGEQGPVVWKVMAKLAGVAFIGGNFGQRTIMTVLFRAARALGAARKDAAVEFFRDEASARAWIDSLRKNHAELSR